MTTPDDRILSTIADAVEFHSTCECGDCAEDYTEHCQHVALGVLVALRNNSVLVVDTSNWKRDLGIPAQAVAE